MWGFIMIYNDGVEMDNELKVTLCPRCENEVMSEGAEHCKICGLSLYNYCLGEIISDPNSNHPDYTEYHKNVSDARFCESCGAATTFFEQNILEPWEKFMERLTNPYNGVEPEQEDLPF